ncbi:MAG: hypothetical protein GX030_01195 [Firmicutes bacterium]|nr:hypothetical protein [Bacillota bacterium]
MKRLRRHPWWGVALIVLVILGLGWYRQVRQDDTPAMEKPQIIDDSDLAAQFSTVHLVGHRLGVKEYDFRFDLVEQIGGETPHIVFSNLVDGKLYGQDGKLQYRIDAGWGKWYEKTEELELEQGVTLLTAKDEVVVGPGFLWRSSPNTLESRGRVTIETPSVAIAADHLWAELGSDESVLTDNVVISDHRGSTLIGDKAVYRGQEEIIEVVGPAEIVVLIGGGEHDQKERKSQG